MTHKTTTATTNRRIREPNQCLAEKKTKIHKNVINSNRLTENHIVN